MRLLFVISLVALAALLWASVSIAQHIYRSRLDRKSALTKEGPRTLAASPSKPKTVPADRPDAQRKAS